ncbi:MAG: ammonia-forming cytochrome c nitrite reductase subunit c552 [Bacillota bacterium]
MTKRKALKVAIITSLVALLALAAGVTATSAKSKGELPEYLGSKACLGCHVDKYGSWGESGHAHMVTQVFKPSDLPGDINTASEEQKAELQKAAWIVAGQRFLARDPNTGALSYLNVRWDSAKQQYVSYKGGNNWETGCAGCHSTGWDKSIAEFAEPGIGCEMCHGPGRDHVLGKGDISLITTTTNSAACGQCHNGSGKAADGTGWPVGYHPSMESLEEAGFTYHKVDPEGPVPEYNKPKLRQYAMWEASAHAQAYTLTVDRNREYCMNCHTANATLMNWNGETYSIAEHGIDKNGVTCAVCHEPHNSTEPGQLRMEPQALCISCHNVHGKDRPLTLVRPPHAPQAEMLGGYAAYDIPETKGAHSDLKCIDCHMTEGNHMMKVIKPEDVIGTTRKDSCTKCHDNSSAESRDVYLSLWQESVSRRMEIIDADVKVIEEVIKANPNFFTKAQMDEYVKARANYWFVMKDHSKGAHNFEYAIKILTKAQKDIAAFRKATGR